jgi:hypothetical protein
MELSTIELPTRKLRFGTLQRTWHMRSEGLPGALMHEDLMAMHAHLQALGSPAPPKQGATSIVRKAPSARDATAYLCTTLHATFIRHLAAINCAQVPAALWSLLRFVCFNYAWSVLGAAQHTRTDRHGFAFKFVTYGQPLPTSAP